MNRLMGFCFLAFWSASSAAYANEVESQIISCAETQDSLARLSCYDTLAQGMNSAEVAPSVQEAFEKFRDIARSDFRPDGGAKELFINECVLFDSTFLGERATRGSFWSPAEGKVKHMDIPADVNYMEYFQIWTMMIDLREVDPEELSLTVKGSTTIVMRRGVEYRWASISAFLNRNRYPTVEEARSAGLRISSIAENISAFSNPALWSQYTSDKALMIGTIIPGDPDSYLAPWTLNATFEPLSGRSERWGFSSMWPEDAKKIHDAFEELVRACQA